MVHDIDLGSNFMDLTSKTLATKEKIANWNYIKLKNLLQSKENNPISHFIVFFLLKVLAMNSGQEWLINRLGGRRGREGLGEGRTNSPRPRLGSWRICTGERTWWEAGRGTQFSGGFLEPHCLRKIFTCIHHTGATALSCLLGTRGMLGPRAL